MPITVQLIVIGDEILIGQTTDTNSGWIANELDQYGFSLQKIHTIGDDQTSISTALTQALSSSSPIILLTGGLGTTADDITKKTLAHFFETKLTHDADILQHIQKQYAHQPNVLNQQTSTQADVPIGFQIIQNSVGTAPIFWIEKREKVMVAMPGVPLEMKMAMEKSIIPSLVKKFNPVGLIHKTIQTFGIPESVLSMQLEKIEKALPTHIKLAYLPSNGIVKLRLTAKQEKNRTLHPLTKAYQQLTQILKPHIFAYDDTPLEALLGSLLKEKQLTVGTAESCTGGLIAQLLTSVSGSSDYYIGTIVAYQNQIKEKLLQVSHDELLLNGAVSQPVVEQMARGLRQQLGADIAIATSGIAGPQGGTPQKPVGTVHISVSSKHSTESQQFNISNKGRAYIMQRTAQTALYMTVSHLQKHY